MTVKPTTSERKRVANRQNAKRSTGPKSETGKRVAALNAIRHGLSSSAAVSALSPEIFKLQELIQEEIDDPEGSRLIAQKILEYERTEVYQRQVALKEASGKDGYIDEAAVSEFAAKNTLEGFLGEDFAINFMDLLTTDGDRAGHNIHKRITKLLDRQALRNQRLLATQAQRESIRMRRYFKRASNQLIKAIKAASQLR